MEHQLRARGSTVQCGAKDDVHGLPNWLIWDFTWAVKSAEYCPDTAPGVVILVSDFCHQVARSSILGVCGKRIVFKIAEKDLNLFGMDWVMWCEATVFYAFRKRDLYIVRAFVNEKSDIADEQLDVK
jgi:hypothetical protein